MKHVSLLFFSTDVSFAFFFGAEEVFKFDRKQFFFEFIGEDKKEEKR